MHISVFLFVCCLQIDKTSHSAVMAWFLVLETLTKITNALQGCSVILMCLNWYRYSWSAVRPHMCHHSLDRIILVKKPSGLCSKTCFPSFSFHISHPLSLVNHYGLININLTICVAQALMHKLMHKSAVLRFCLQIPQNIPPEHGDAEFITLIIEDRWLIYFLEKNAQRRTHSPASGHIAPICSLFWNHEVREFWQCAWCPCSAASLCSLC